MTEKQWQHFFVGIDLILISLMVLPQRLLFLVEADLDPPANIRVVVLPLPLGPSMA